eukprot:1759146-Pyramimonas_sp.AAC.1
MGRTRYIPRAVTNHRGRTRYIPRAGTNHRGRTRCIPRAGTNHRGRTRYIPTGEPGHTPPPARCRPSRRGPPQRPSPPHTPAEPITGAKTGYIPGAGTNRRGRTRYIPTSGVAQPYPPTASASQLSVRSVAGERSSNKRVESKSGMGGGKDSGYTYYNRGVLLARAMHTRLLTPPNTNVGGSTATHDPFGVLAV